MIQTAPTDLAQDEEGFTITSNDACVAAATTTCSSCQANIEVICIFCRSGLALDEPLAEFTVSDIWAIDTNLQSQLEPWPTFHPLADQSAFANHCPHCQSPQDDMELHSEPDHVFFNIPRAEPGRIHFTPLDGEIRLSGSESFEI
jgi:hypothetical protein